MSDTLFVDSTSPQGCPSTTSAPTAGRVTKTMSPNASCAWSVMPKRTTPSEVGSTHSCSRV